MAKLDFCFTYYDGDAARDMAHMNRLERGCYTDIIISQRKFGHLSLAQIKKILSKDFEECWPAIELVMLQDEAGKFYIEWLRNSIETGRSHSKKQKENIGKRYQTPTNPLPKNDLVTPLGDGDGNRDQDVFKGRGAGEGGIVPEMVEEFVLLNPGYPVDKETDYPSMREVAEKIKKCYDFKGLITDPITSEKIKRRWGELTLHIKSDSHFCKYSISQINKHFQSVIQGFNSKKNGTHKQTIGKNHGKSAGIIGIIDDLAKEAGLDPG